MLTKITDTTLFSLLPLLSALFFVAGMPLLHPILHSHSESYHIISEHREEHIPAFADKDHEPNCPICDFLAASQFYDTSKGCIITEIEPVGIIISIKHLFLAKLCSLQVEPRAPPTGNSLRKSVS